MANKISFYNQLKAETKAKHNLGKLLLSNYKNDINTETEKMVLSEIEKIIIKDDTIKQPRTVDSSTTTS
jgi:hypothetical protein